MRVFVEIDRDRVLECATQFLFQVLNEVAYPAIEVVVVAVGDEDVVFVAWEKRHSAKILK